MIKKHKMTIATLQAQIRFFEKTLKITNKGIEERNICFHVLTGFLNT